MRGVNGLLLGVALALLSACMVPSAKQKHCQANAFMQFIFIALIKFHSGH